MKAAKVICSILIGLALYHFGVAIHQTGLREGLGTDVYFAGYLSNPWQAVIDFDLIAGLTLAASWVVWRERDRLVALAWVAVLLYWGNLVVAIYVYRQLCISQGEWVLFFLGKHAESSVAGVGTETPLARRLILYTVAAAMTAFVIYGCWSTHFAPASVMGYVWGLGSLILSLLLLARSRRAGTTDQPSG